MARTTILQVEELGRVFKKLSEVATDATDKVNDLKVAQALAVAEGREITQKQKDALRKAQAEETIAKRDATKVQREYNDIVGESTQEFKSLAQDLRDFGGDVKRSGKTFDNLLGENGAEKFTEFFTQINETQGNLITDTERLRKRLNTQDLTEDQTQAIMKEIEEKEYQLELYKKISGRLKGTFDDLKNIGTDSAKLKVDFGERQRMRDEISANMPKKADGTPDMRFTKSKQGDKSLKALETDFAKEDTIVGINRAFADTVDQTGKIRDNITSFTDKIPLVGKYWSRFVNDEFEQAVQLAGADLARSLSESEDGIKKSSAAQLLWNRITEMNPYVKIAAVVLAIATAISMAVNYTRDLSKELGSSVTQATKLQGSIMAASVALIGTGKSAKTIAGELSDTFGTLNQITAGNIVQIGQLATRYGAETKEIISIQKQLMDMTGASNDQATELIRNIGNLAVNEGVAAGNVIADIASNMATFAEFSTMGAQGLAEAAVQAAKVGSSLENVTKFAEKLLDFESSITSEFEAQVLTGKNLNLERARELALEGNMGELSKELQKQVGGLGNIQTMNNVEKRAISAAIGVSVADLQKISRGEAIEQKKTQEDLLQQLIEVNKKGFAGNQEAFNAKDSSFGDFMNFGDV
jgi:hypothetical protein